MAAEPTHARKLAETVLACALVGAGTWLATWWVLGSTAGSVGELPPVTFPDAIRNEPNDYRADLMAAAHTVRERWSYLEHRADIDGVDLDRRLDEALRLAGEEPDARTFQRALTYLIAGLHDGHAFAAATEYHLPGSHRWPFALREVREGILVTASMADEVARGDLLLTVDERGVEEWITETEQRVYASAAPARRAKAIEHMCAWDDARSRRFGIRRANGSDSVVELELPRSAVAVPVSPAPPSDRLHQLRADGIGYLRPGHFSPPPDSGWPGPPERRDEILAEAYADFDRRIGELEGARAIVLDLRGNPGGTDLLGQFLVDRLVDGDSVYFRLTALGPGGWRDTGGLRSSAPSGARSLVGKPLAVLVDEHTFSTADNVAACLRDEHPDVRFVGRPNGAGSGAPRPFTLPRTGSTITFATQRVRSASGRMVEGVPVAIDVPVIWTRADVLGNLDPDLAAAIETLAR